MITVLSLLRYDAPHALWAARQVSSVKPAIVALELPQEFQPLLDRYVSGKMPEKRFLAEFKKLIGRRAGAPSSEDAVAKVVLAARKAGSRVFAVDSSFNSLRHELGKHVIASGSGREAALRRAAASLVRPDAGFLTFFEFAHAPFHFLELLMGHHPEEGPDRHKPDCLVCRWGVAWERAFHSFYAVTTNLLNPIGEAKYVSALRTFDKLREERMVRRLMELHGPSAASKGRSIVFVVHLWHAAAVEDALKDLRIQVA